MAGRNVLRMVNENKRIAEGNKYISDMFDLHSQADWHAEMEKNDSAHRVKVSRMKVHDELRMVNQEHIAVRRKKLQQLYADEILAYEDELNSMGLSISKEVD